ncbi:MAG: hypothetical protein Q9166_001952 [cf. Caloplaca sp. 2 TL-2023]
MVPPQALQIGPAWENGTPSFMQQGQVDWVAFGNTIWSASAAVLQRFASSGIQPVTFGAGLALASEFRMSTIGRQRMDHTMQNLRGVPGLGKILWFGFGYQSFVRMMGESQLGLNTVALCSCLTEVHSEETAARVLEELWKLNEFPENYEPSHTQYLALVKACSGVLASSTFNSRINSMTGHGRWGFDRDRGYNQALKASNASDIARALHALFQITRGGVERITLLGQVECAFIAAMGHWLFDLAIYIENDAGEVIFTSGEHVGREEAQVLEVEHVRALVGLAVNLATVTDSVDEPGPKSETLLEEIRPLFDGSLRDIGPSGEPGRIVADASSGICCYRECLHGISSEAGVMRIIHVIPGHIERNTAQYDIVDDQGFENRVPPIAEPVSLARAESTFPKHEPIQLGKFEIKALATESSLYRRLHFGYKVFLPNGSISQIQPGLLSNQVLERTGVLWCYRSKKCKQRLAFPCSPVLQGWAVEKSTQGLHYNSQIALCLWLYSEDTARCVAFDLQNEGTMSPRTTFLRRDECLPCCSESVL